VSAPTDEAKDFNALYGTRCRGCHGADGKLGPAPPLNDPIFLAIVPEAELVRVISKGRTVTPAQKTPMPAFARDQGGPLTEPEIKTLAQGIKKCWVASPSGGLPAYLAGSSAGDKDRGARVFARACAGCHGTQGNGERDGKPLQGGALNQPAFLALISDQALRRTIITGRPDLGMPAYNGSTGRPPDFHELTSAEIEDLVALLRSWRQRGGTP
jgi:cytochrome c oxidase cbb3-type subunit 3/ubiquinol-cytochrome c reductase cytochrome c subunit